jgi:rhodanese-related sulfurtransferase
MLQFFKRMLGGTNESLQGVIQSGAVIIDVRTRDEYNQGHLKGSKNIPLNEIRLKSEIIRSWGKPVITVCRSGNRSQIAKEQIEAFGVETYNGGAWTSFKNKYSL